jgi:hypothetical protein
VHPTDQSSTSSIIAVINLLIKALPIKSMTKRQKMMHSRTKNSSLVILRSSGMHAVNTVVQLRVVYQYVTPVGISSNVMTSRRISTDNDLPRDG